MKKLIFVLLTLVLALVVACGEEKTPTITITGESTVYVGSEITLKAELANLEGEINWYSSDENVATVSGGKVLGVNPGAVTITVVCGEVNKTYDIIVKGVPVLEVSGEKDLIVGETLTLTVKQEYLESEISWATSDEAVATVKDGVVTAVGAGSATITASSGDLKKEITINVQSTMVFISGKATMYVGEKNTLKAEIQNANFEGPYEFEWASSEDDVATINSKGEIEAKSTGVITFTATCNGFTGSFVVEIVLKKEIIISGDKKVDANDTLELTAELVNIEGEVTWSSSDESVAVVDDKGVVTGVNPGLAVISATIGDVVGKYTISVFAATDKITYNYNGGTSEELYMASTPLATLTLTSYNANNGAFWGGGYSSNVYICTKEGDPKATFSDRVYIGKNEYTGFYEIKSILTSGGSSWADGAEYVICISSSYSDYRTQHAKVQKLAVGDIAIVNTNDIKGITGSKNATCYFFSPNAYGETVTVQKDKYTGSLVNPARLGYEFKGWFDKEGQKIENLSKDQVVGNVKLTAKWELLNPVTNIDINNVPTSMLTDEKFQVNASVVPSDAYFKDVLFTTSDKDIINVSENGLLTAVNSGKATITITDFIGNVVLKYEITVDAIASLDVTFPNDYTGVLGKGKTVTLVPNTLGIKDSNVKFEYTSKNTQVATVDANGVVTGINPGEAIIEVKCGDYVLEIGVSVVEYTETDLVDQVLALLAANNFAEVEVGNACMYNDSTTRYYKATYGSVNRFLFQDLEIDRTYASTAENNPNGHRSRRFSGGFDDSIEFVTVHDTATLTGTSESIAKGMAEGGTSIHYSTGNYKVWEVVPEKYIAYHAGDGTGTPFRWIATGVKAEGNVAPEYDIYKNGSKWYFILNGQKTNLECPISNGSKTIANPSKEHLSHLGPVWKVVDGQYYIGNTWVCFSQVAAGVIGSFGGNNNSIGIEMSVNTSNDMYDTYQRTAKLVADILVRNGLDTTRVKQHNTWTGKNCPQVLIAGNYWNDFMKMVEIEYTMMTTYKDAKITMKSNNPEIVDDTGRVKNAPQTATTVSYTVTVTAGNTTKTQTFYSVVPGTTSWHQMNGIYKSAIIWNKGNFVVNR